METSQSREPWNKGKLIGQKPPLKLKDIWAIRIHLQVGKRIRDLAMFNLAIDSKLRGCDLVTLLPVAQPSDLKTELHHLPEVLVDGVY